MKTNTLNTNLLFRLLLVVSAALCSLFSLRYLGAEGELRQAALLAAGLTFLLPAGIFVAYRMRNKWETPLQVRSLGIGLGIGLLWVIEIGINNLVRPGLPLRDQIDNFFWAMVALGIWAKAYGEALRSGRLLSGLAAGWWSGLGSGVMACVTALLLAVFGQKLLRLDPLNQLEWADQATHTYPDIGAFLAAQTFAGAILHLVALGAFMGVVLGLMGGVVGITARGLRRKDRLS